MVNVKSLRPAKPLPATKASTLKQLIRIRKRVCRTRIQRLRLSSNSNRPETTPFGRLNCYSYGRASTCDVEDQTLIVNFFLLAPLPTAVLVGLKTLLAEGLFVKTELIFALEADRDRLVNSSASPEGNTIDARIFFYASSSKRRNFSPIGLTPLDIAGRSVERLRTTALFISAGAIYVPVVLRNKDLLVSLGKLNGAEYSAVIRNMDTVLSLHHRPYQSYSPLDVLDAGAFPVTNELAFPRSTPHTVLHAVDSDSWSRAFALVTVESHPPEGGFGVTNKFLPKLLDELLVAVIPALSCE